jgi:RNA recognition motif-containing protein
MGKKLFVTGLDWGITDRTLREAFEPHGKVVEAVVIRSRRDGRSRGFGFVTFDHEEQAAAAMEALNGDMIASRAVRVERARDQSETTSNGRNRGGRGGGRKRGRNKTGNDAKPESVRSAEGSVFRETPRSNRRRVVDVAPKGRQEDAERSEPVVEAAE